jgi:MFS family permease
MRQNPAANLKDACMYPARLTLIVGFLFCGNANACTPVATLAYLMTGTSLYGLAIGGTGGGPILALAMLAAAIAFKAAVYSRYAGYGKVRAAFDMFLGNIASTIAGVLIGITVASSSMTLPAIAVSTLVLGAVAASVFSKCAKVMNPWLLSLLTCFAMFASFVLLLLAESADPSKVMEDSSYALVYFALKTVGIFFAIAASLAISVVFEGAVIFSAHRKDESFPRDTVISALLKANVYMFLAISLIGLAFAIPNRWASPNFIWVPDTFRR